jgi:hypothetical protein
MRIVGSLFEHDLSGKPVSTFPDHAPASCPRFNETSALSAGSFLTGDGFSISSGDRMMKKSASLALAAALVLSGVTAASARSHMSNGTSGASDTLSLSDTQQQSIWKDVSKHATNQNAPADFNAAVGTEIPSGLSTYPMPRQAARDVPAVKPYRYAMTQDKVLIVNPSDHKIADVVAPTK